jgi:hypothetical protein
LNTKDCRPVSMSHTAIIADTSIESTCACPHVRARVRARVR